MYQPIWFSLEGDEIKLTNHDYFTPLDVYDYRYEILTDGVKTSEGPLKLRGDILSLPPIATPNAGTWMNVYACLREPKPWADAGYAIAREQFELVPYQKNISPVSAPAPKFSKKGGNVEIRAGKSSYIIDKTGAMASWKVDGREMLAGALEPYFGKPDNANQSKNGYYMNDMQLWETEAARREVKSINAEKTGEGVKVTARMTLPAGADYTLTYTVDGAGRMLVEADYMPTREELPLMPKFGMRMRLPAEMTSIEYLGRGPQENYPDRKRGYFMGRYAMPLSEYQHDYIRPQDNGNRCDVHWLTLASAADKGMPVVKIEGIDNPLCIRAWDYDEDALRKAAHPYELKRGGFVNVNIDHNVHGVGGTDTWGRPTLDQYTIKGNEPHRYSFMLSAE